MCYYNGQKVTRSEYIRLKHLEKLLANYDFLMNDLQSGFDYGTSAVLKRMEDKVDFDLVKMEWGFIPSYRKSRDEVNRMRFGYKDATGKFIPPITTLNAVAEELLKPGKIYREAGLKRRCLILSSGFYEWRHIYPIGKKTGKPLKTPVAYPYHIGVKDAEYFYMAGIWQPWTDRITGEYVESFAIVTTAANSLMEQVHNTKKRMPTILGEDLGYEWMFGNLSEDRITVIAKTQFPASQMFAYSIDKDFRKSVEPTKAVAYPDLTSLVVEAA